MSKKEFASPPRKGIMKLLSDANITPPDPKVNTAADLLLDQINSQEEECLKTIHCRYCIIKGLPISVGDVSRYYPNKAQNPNYYEYWYKFGKKSQYMLMTRELKITEGGVILDIIFNKELVRAGE